MINFINTEIVDSFSEKTSQTLHFILTNEDS